MKALFLYAARSSLHLALLLICILVPLAGGTVAALGQSALDGFDPNANGAIRVVVVQPDGRILLGGDFTTLAPNGGPTVTRNRIARLNQDGTLDTAFNPNASASVAAIAVQADGKILAGEAVALPMAEYAEEHNGSYPQTLSPCEAQLRSQVRSQAQLGNEREVAHQTSSRRSCKTLCKTPRLLRPCVQSHAPSL